MLEHLSDIISMLGSAVTGIAVPLIGVLMYRDFKKRTEAAKAKQAEAEARRVEEENITTRAEEWRKLYEEESDERKKRDEKIDLLYQEKEADRQRIRELTEKNLKLTLDLQKAEFMKCEVKGCDKRQPPTGY